MSDLEFWLGHITRRSPVSFAQVLIDAERAEWAIERVERLIETLLRTRALELDQQGILRPTQEPT